MSDRCKRCRRQIKWARTENGKPMPLDFHPNRDGNIELVNGIAKVLAGDVLEAARASNTVLHMPHFATCPVKPGVLTGR